MRWLSVNFPPYIIYRTGSGHVSNRTAAFFNFENKFQRIRSWDFVYIGTGSDQYIIDIVINLCSGPVGHHF